MGLIPLIVGLVKKRKALAWIGFAACAVSGAILGLLLSLPVAIVFLIVILVRSRKLRKRSDGGSSQAPTAATGREPWNLPPQDADAPRVQNNPWDK